MSSPLLFFIIVIVIDLILKSTRDKKKIEAERQKRQRELQGRPDLNQQNSMGEVSQKPESIRGMMSTLREEIEKERLKEIERRQGKTKAREQVKNNVEQKEVTKKEYEDSEYWGTRRKEEKDRKNKEVLGELQIEVNKNDMREDIIRGIIFSEILSEPKSIQNKKRSI